MQTLKAFRSKAPGRLVLCPLILILGLATVAYGCACCAEPGTWFHESRKPNAEVISILGDLQRRFGGTATVFTTAAGLEDIRGIDRAVESYTLKSAGSRAREWKLEFVDEKGNRGTLSFMVPNTFVSFGVDPGDGQLGGGGGPSLYKEWRLQGPVTGSGIFRRGVGAGARFRLVLQGRGNMCGAAEDFKSWILQVNGPRADFSLYGQFKHPGTSRVSTFAERNSLVQPASPIVLEDTTRAALDGELTDVYMLSVRSFRKSKYYGKTCSDSVSHRRNFATPLEPAGLFGPYGRT